MDKNKLDIADYINHKYAEAVMPLLGRRNEIDRALIDLDIADRGFARGVGSIAQFPLSEQADLVEKRGEINRQIRAFQSQSQEKQWIREYSKEAGT